MSALLLLLILLGLHIAAVALQVRVSLAVALPACSRTSYCRTSAFSSSTIVGRSKRSTYVASSSRSTSSRSTTSNGLLASNSAAKLRHVVSRYTSNGLFASSIKTSNSQPFAVSPSSTRLFLSRSSSSSSSSSSTISSTRLFGNSISTSNSQPCAISSRKGTSQSAAPTVAIDTSPVTEQTSARCQQHQHKQLSLLGQSTQKQNQHFFSAIR
jgi:hypothetical protein